MEKKKRIRLIPWLAGFALIAVAAGLMIWMLGQPNDPMFHGKPESAWIKGIVYRGSDEQTQEWRELGPEGIQFLARALNRGNGSIAHFYEDTWPKLPQFLQRHLPQPVDSGPTRMCAGFLLIQLGDDAKPAIPALEKSLRVERRGSARGIVVNCFIRFVPKMDAKEKAESLPYFIQGMKSRDDSERNNSAIVLGLYPEQSGVVAPVLAQALHDSNPGVCLVAAESLNQIDPQAAAKAGAVTVVIGFLNGPDDQIARRAAGLLGQMGARPELAVPALIAAANGTNLELAASSLSALGNFKSEAATVIPVLEKARDHPDRHMRYTATNALQRIDPKRAKQPP